MLAVSFHRTFIPERHFLASLLHYAASGKEGTLQDMAAQTGIPMGKSNGKMPAILDYAVGMGLVEVSINKGSAIRKPILTPFGAIVYQEDKYLGEQIVQWLVHLNLCRHDIGAKVWHLTFASGRKILGSCFSRRSLDDYLAVNCGNVKDRIGPLINTYLEEAALARSGVLRVEGDTIVRQKAPLDSKYGLAYSAYILSLLDIFFSKERQVSFTDFNNKTLFFETCLWNEADIENLSTILERKGFISIDRQRKPWIMERYAKGRDVWPNIFDEMA